jgi:hypothetical protein
LWWYKKNYQSDRMGQQRLARNYQTVGYNPPNDRAEVSRLITDIRNSFNIRVGIIDFESLLKLAIATVRGYGSSYVDEVRNLEGLIDVEII